MDSSMVCGDGVEKWCSVTCRKPAIGVYTGGVRGKNWNARYMCNGWYSEDPLRGFWQEQQAHKLNDGRNHGNSKHPPAHMHI